MVTEPRAEMSALRVGRAGQSGTDRAGWEREMCESLFLSFGGTAGLCVDTEQHAKGIQVKLTCEETCELCESSSQTSLGVAVQSGTMAQ